MTGFLDKGTTYAELLAARQRYRLFKQRFWDVERNHIQVEHAEEFYQLFRAGIIARRNYDMAIAPPEEQKTQPQQLSLCF